LRPRTPKKSPKKITHYKPNVGKIVISSGGRTQDDVTEQAGRLNYNDIFTKGLSNCGPRPHRKGV
ncbi:hypothetical protein FRC19_003207, partial [Serendipita sp. 401]